MQDAKAKKWLAYLTLQKQEDVIYFFLVGHWIATKKHKIRLWCCHRITPVILSNLYTSLAFPLYLGCEVVSESMVLCISAVLTQVAVSS